MIFKYLKGTLSYGIMFINEYSDPSVVRYVDSYYVGDIDDIKSTTWYVFILIEESIY